MTFVTQFYPIFLLDRLSPWLTFRYYGVQFNFCNKHRLFIEKCPGLMVPIIDERDKTNDSRTESPTFIKLIMGTYVRLFLIIWTDILYTRYESKWLFSRRLGYVRKGGHSTTIYKLSTERPVSIPPDIRVYIYTNILNMRILLTYRIFTIWMFVINGHYYFMCYVRYAGLLKILIKTT